MDLSIIIVNWNSKEYLKKCLTSILTTTSGINCEIIVIDNASYDGCEKMLKHCFKQVHFIQSAKNLGFAKANNYGFKVSKGKNILFLNPDTEVKEQAIQRLLFTLKSIDDAGIVGAKLLNSNGSIQTSCVQAFPTILNQVLDAELIRNLSPKSRLWGIAPLFSETDAPSKVDVVSGACLMIRRKVFEKVGMFSTEYFMYSEDVDLCHKVNKAGWKTYYVPDAVVVHYGGGSSSQVNVNTFSSVMILESRWRFFKKTRPLWYCWLYRVGIFLSSLLRIGLTFVIFPLIDSNGDAIALQFTLKKWFSKLSWALGREAW